MVSVSITTGGERLYAGLRRGGDVGGVADAVAAGVVPGVLDRASLALDAHNLAGVGRHRQAQGPRAAAE